MLVIVLRAGAGGGHGVRGGCGVGEAPVEAGDDVGDGVGEVGGCGGGRLVG